MKRLSHNNGICTLTDSNFCSKVLCYRGSILVLFFAEWSGSSQLMIPVLEKLAEEFTGRLKVGILDVDTNIKIRSRFGIHGVPTLLLFNQGVLEAGYSGIVSRGCLSKTIGALLVHQAPVANNSEKNRS